MSAENTSKINKLLSSIPSGVVLQSFWLAKQGYSPELQKRYRNSGWLESIGSGAMKRAGELITYEGASTLYNINPACQHTLAAKQR
jgi:hypothetical protein